MTSRTTGMPTTKPTSCRLTERSGAADTVVILAPVEDVHARSVAYEIETHFGGSAVILDTAEYPRHWHLAVSVHDGATAWEVSFGDRCIRSTEVAGLWWRRVHAHDIAAEISDERVRSFCESEARTALLGWVYGLGAAAINPLGSERAASQKTFQLTTACALGVPVPRSLITNSPEAVRQFYDVLEGEVVFKVQTPPHLQMLETRELRREHLDYLSLLNHAPVMFQERITGTDIRVTIVDDDVFAVAIKPRHPGAALDWRLDTAPDYEPYDLPVAARTQLIALLRQLGLRYGAIDLRVTPEGRHVLLEVNTGGQYLFVEIQAGLPISRALAAALLRGAPPLNLRSESGERSRTVMSAMTTPPFAR